MARAAWRAGRAALARAVCAEWGLRAEGVLAEAAALVLAVRDAAGRPAVLKLAPPGQGLGAELAALAAFDPARVLAPLRQDAARGAVLLPRALPGTPLTWLARRDDDAATRAAAPLIAALPVAPPPGVPFAEAAGWGRALAAGAGVLPPAMLDRAAGLLRELAADAPPARLLHGDLHHGNILSHAPAPGGWVAVDPKGLLGEPAAEAAALLRNPPEAALLARAARRVAVLAEATGLDRARLAAWGYAGAVIAACWAVEDGADPAPWLAAEAALRVG